MRNFIKCWCGAESHGWYIVSPSTGKMLFFPAEWKDATLEVGRKRVEEVSGRRKETPDYGPYTSAEVEWTLKELRTLAGLHSDFSLAKRK